MKIIGLTGLIGSGKTTAGAMLKEKGLPVFDADAVVHDMMDSHEKMIAAFRKHLPFCVVNDCIDRKILAEKVATGDVNVKKLEKIIYPFLKTLRDDFLRQNSTQKAVVLDVPLLFEARWNEICDVIIMMTAPEDVLKQRVMNRSFMNEKKYDALRRRQTSAEEKAGKSTYVVDSSKGYDFVRKSLDRILEDI